MLADTGLSSSQFNQLRRCLRIPPDPSSSTTTTVTLYSVALVKRTTRVVYVFRGRRLDGRKSRARDVLVLAVFLAGRLQSSPSSSTMTLYLAPSIPPAAIATLDAQHTTLPATPARGLPLHKPLHNRHDHGHSLGVFRISPSPSSQSQSQTFPFTVPTEAGSGTPRDIGTLLFLVANWFVNGETVLIDGGVNLAQAPVVVVVAVARSLYTTHRTINTNLDQIHSMVCFPPPGRLYEYIEQKLRTSTTRLD
ncbi:hypothetical protein C8F01DRAFT_1266579 [Mycena amicta]|nr:hypothetical protein C8F01DRAFT_1266579 [Mycena amicta]